MRASRPIPNRLRALYANNFGGVSAAAAVPSLLITNPNYVCNQCVSGQTGWIKFQGVTAYAGFLDLLGNSYTKVTAPGMTGNTGTIALRNNAITEADFGDMVTGGGVDLWGNPLTSVNFDSLVSLDLNHIYLSRNSSLTSASFPALTTMSRALVFSQDTALATFSAPNLVTLSHEIEFDYCKSLTALSLPSLTTINGTVAGPNIIIGGDMTDIGLSRPPAFNSLSLPVLTDVNSGQIYATWCTNLTEFDISSWVTIANGFALNMNRCNLTQASMDAIFIKLAAILGSVTSGTVDLRFQNGGQVPSASGQAAAANLVAAGIRNSQGGTTLYA